MDLLFRTAAFDELAVLQDDDAVIVDDALEAMGDADYDAVMQSCADDALHHRVGLLVRRRSGFVQNKNPRRAKQPVGQVTENGQLQVRIKLR